MIDNTVKRIASGIQDLVFPENLYCICCGNIIDGTRTYSLCDHCISHIRWNIEEPRVIETEYGNVYMLKCVDYGIYERSMIFALKYDGHKYIARNIAKIMKDRLVIDNYFLSGEDWIIVPVPLHKKRLKERGYNHAELIAKYLGKELSVPVEDILVRLRNTAPMKGLGPEKREKNIINSIVVKTESSPLSCKNILLIDDFYTTGSTAKECLRALRKSGFSGKIVMLSFAAR